MRSQCTILFEDPFWIGLFEIWCGSEYEVCKVVFGKEPKSNEVYEWILASYSNLQFKKTTQDEAILVKKVNPKKLKKQIMRQVDGKYQGTKAQQTLQSMHEAEKVVRKQRSREQKEAALKQLFELKQEKKKQKKRGH